MEINIKCNTTLSLLCLFVGFIFFPSFLFAQNYGLKFRGNDVTLDKRTELNLTPNGFLKLEDEFVISFDYKATRLRPGSNVGLFGYIFRIITKENKNIDLLSTSTPDVGLSLVIGESNSITPIKYPSGAMNNWIQLRVKFLLSEDRLIFYTPDTFYVHEKVGFAKQERVKIIFGANDYMQFKNSDVPSMTIKGLKIIEKGKLKYHWVLDEFDGDIATDKVRGKEAKVINPSWEIQNHSSWQTVFKDKLLGDVRIAADCERERIFMIGSEECCVYYPFRNNARKIKYKNKPLFFGRNYRTIYNRLNKKIYCYAEEKDELFHVLDTEKFEWNNHDASKKISDKVALHNQFYRESDNSIYIFGGYGSHRYNNRIRRIDLSAGSCTNLPTDSTIFTPRYLAALGSLNDTLYIFGGYGSKSGNQLINPQSNFDLLGYSIKDSSLFKKFEIPHIIDDMIVGNSLWIDGCSRKYYALIFSKIKFDNELQLIQGSLDSPKIELVGDKIPFKFLDINSAVDLFYMPTQNKLYAYTSYKDDSTTQVAIYSIGNPPSKTQLEALAPTSNRLWLYLMAAVFVFMGMAFLFYYRRKRTKSEVKYIVIGGAAEKAVSFEEKTVVHTLEYPDYNLISFGGFQVFNKNREDTTNKFSPLLKELFLLIFLHSYKDNKGISSEKLTEELWYDKSEKSARNNRAVNIAKLRGIMEEVGQCELSQKTGYWKIIFENSSIKSDYVDFLNITSSKNNLTKQRVKQLIAITQKGAFLSNVNYEWLDDFKASVSDTIINTLVEFGQSCDIKAEADFIIHLADSIFNFDIINEDAMILKCKAQYFMGKHSHAKTTYERFFKEYLSMYGQEYDQAFLDILEIKE